MFGDPLRDYLVRFHTRKVRNINMALLDGFMVILKFLQGDPATDQSAPDESNSLLTHHGGSGSAHIYYSSLAAPRLIIKELKHYLVLVSGSIRLKSGFKAQQEIVEDILYGIDSGIAVDKLFDEYDGSYSLILWDSQSKRAFFTVDRVGITKLYYHYSKDRIILSSHVKNISRHAKLKELDPQGFEYYVSLRLIPAPATILKDVYKVSPGYYGIADGSSQAECEYWPLLERARAGYKLPYKTALDTLDELVSISLQSCSGAAQDPVGIFLSSGVDSALLAAMLKRMDVPLIAYTAGYDQKYHTDESLIAGRIAGSLNLRHEINRPSAHQLFLLLKQVVDLTPEPLADASFLSQLALTRQAMEHSSVFIDGSGADNLFGGMSKTKAESMLRYYDLIPVAMRPVISRIVTNLPSSRKWVVTDNIRKLKKFIGGAELPEEQRQLYWIRFIQDDWLEKILAPQWNHDTDHTHQLFQNVFDQVGSSDRQLLASSYFGLKNIMPWMAVFKLSCIEQVTNSSIRNPYLSQALIEFALCLPDEYKQKGNVNKLILRQVAQKYLEPRFANRTKRNFSPPIGRWMKDEFRSYILDNIYLHDYFNKQTLEGMLSEQFNDQHDWQLELWTVFIFQKWWEGLLN
jgi:asparagine synthase (glutamine-hydrolysing)